MQGHWLDWANFLLRWAHVVTAIAWIGSSFYFVMLDLSLTKPEHQDLKDKGVDGELWAVHGGGFYHSQKYMVAPRWLPLPSNMHWSFWESYSTWLTGFALFAVLYLANAGTFLVDRNVHVWSAGSAATAALVYLVAGWFVYDAICRLFGEREGGDRTVGILVAVYVVVAAWVACHFFAGRAAFLLTGAMLATAMSANVFFWIIPGQKTVIEQLRAGRAPDPIHGRRGKQRSVHNTYFTLPVVVAMLSNHYPWLYQGRFNWVVLVLVMLAAALIRHSFVARHKAHVEHRPTPWGPAIAGCVILAGLAVALMPARPSAAEAAAVRQAATGPAGYAEVRAILDQRCTACHNAALQQKNVALHTPALVGQHAQAVLQQAVLLKTMPLNNATGMTEAERATIRRWFDAGAPTR